MEKYYCLKFNHEYKTLGVLFAIFEVFKITGYIPINISGYKKIT